MSDDKCGTTHARPNVTGALMLSNPSVALVGVVDLTQDT
jgi:hypothetical protein